MKRLSVLLIVLVSGALLLMACSDQERVDRAVQMTVEAQRPATPTKSVPPTATSAPAQTITTPTSLPIVTAQTGTKTISASSSLSESIVGAWQCQDGEMTFYEFTDNDMLITPLKTGSYEVINEYTIIFTADDGETVLRVNDLQLDTLILDTNGINQQCHRVAAVTDLSNAIVGLWIGENVGNRLVMEFFPDGRILFGDDDGKVGVGRYKVLSNNSVEIFDTPAQKTAGAHLFGVRFLWLVKETPNNTFTFDWERDSPIIATREDGHPNLAERIVGIWRTKYGDEIELTDNGLYIFLDNGEIVSYKVLSNNTFLFGEDPEDTESLLYHIVELTDNSFSWVDWGEDYQNTEPFVWTRVTNTPSTAQPVSEQPIGRIFETNGLPPSKNALPLELGQRVRLRSGIQGITIRTQPGATDGDLVGYMEPPTTATVINGPVWLQGNSDTVVWWFIRTDAGIEAWAPANTSEFTLLEPVP